MLVIYRNMCCMLSGHCSASLTYNVSIQLTTVNTYVIFPTITKQKCLASVIFVLRDSEHSSLFEIIRKCHNPTYVEVVHQWIIILDYQITIVRCSVTKLITYRMLYKIWSLLVSQRNELIWSTQKLNVHMNKM